MCTELNVELRGLFFEEIPPVPSIIEEVEGKKTKNAQVKAVQVSTERRGGKALPMAKNGQPINSLAAAAKSVPLPAHLG